MASSTSINVRKQIADALSNLLRQASANAPYSPKPDQIVVVPSGFKLLDAFQQLIDNNILSAPVYESSLKNFIGFLDCRDLVAFCIYASNEENWSPSVQDLVSMSTKSSSVPAAHITASYLARRHPYLFVYSSDDLFSVAQKLAARDCHRVPIVDPKTSEMVGLVTQSALIKWIYDQRIQIGSTLAHRLNELGQIGTRPVITVPSNTPVVEAFTIMERHSISAIGITSPQGELIATTSSSDIKKFLSKRISLSQPILSFIQLLYDDYIDARAPLVCVKMESALEEVIGRMVESKIHRVFVIGNKNEPLEVISITDIMRLITIHK